MKIKSIIVALSLICSAAYATEYKMVVPFGAGSHGDITQRAIAERFNQITGDTIVIENKPGTVATAAINHMKTNKDIDLISLAAGILVVDPVLKEVGYTDSDYNPIIYVGTSPFVWISNTLKSPEDILKQPPEFSGGNAGTGELNLKLLNKSKNLGINYVPYKSAPEAIVGVISNQITLANVGMNTTIAQMTKSDKLHIIGSTYSKDIVVEGIKIPSISARLNIPQFNGFTIIATRPGMDSARQTKLKDGLWKAVQDPKTREKLKDLFFLSDESDDMVSLNKQIQESRKLLKAKIQ
jgi:tripartite-type tricarboxylate transporter receptor subunit TctC